MTTHPVPRLFTRGALALLGLLPLSSARAAAPAPAAGDTIKLEEFSVSAGRASGYRAQSAITATGFGANILDVPVTINVLTGEFVADLGANLQSAVLRYVPGIITSPNYEFQLILPGFKGAPRVRDRPDPLTPASPLGGKARPI